MLGAGHRAPYMLLLPLIEDFPCVAINLGIYLRACGRATWKAYQNTELAFSLTMKIHSAQRPGAARTKNALDEIV